MARRTIEQRIGGLLAYVLGLALIAIGVLIMIVREYPLQLAAVLAAGAAFAHFLKRRAARRSEAEREYAETCTDRQMARHRGELISYFRQSIGPAPFGGEDASLWQRHIETFLDTQVVPALSSASVRLASELGAHLADHVDSWVRDESARTRQSADRPIDPSTLTGIEYEQYCASLLAACGWRVQPTRVTADHGADIIAEKNGTRLAVQCKLYTQPVGNKAVQEVHSARSLYHCDHACVVASGGFTKQAQREAYAHSIGLLHHSQLEIFASGLSRQTGLPFRSATIA